MFTMIKRILTNRDFIFVFAFLGGLLFSPIASYTQRWTIPALAIVLLVSTTQLSTSDFIPLKKLLYPLYMALFFNFFVLGSLFLLLSYWLLPQREIWLGFVLLATAPPGIAIIPFTHIIKGDTHLSLLGTFGAYLVSLFLTPVLVFLLTGGTILSPIRLLTTMIQLILIPLILSQMIQRRGLVHYIAPYRGTIINWGFFLVIFSVVGLNRDVFLGEPLLLGKIAAITFFSTFVLHQLIILWGQWRGRDKEEIRSLALFSTLKNTGFASAIALTLFNEVTSVPGAVASAMYALYFIYLGIKGAGLEKK